MEQPNALAAALASKQQRRQALARLPIEEKLSAVINTYRLIVKIHYNTGIVFIRFVGTHAE